MRCVHRELIRVLYLPKGSFQSTLAPDSLITLPHLSISFFTCAASCSGVLVITVRPKDSSLLMTSLDMSAFAVASLSLDMIAGGVPAGANNAFHVVCSNPGKPDSARVGTSGDTEDLLTVVTPSLLDLGFFGREFGMASNILRHCHTTYPTLLEKLRQHCELIPIAPRSNP